MALDKRSASGAENFYQKVMGKTYVPLRSDESLQILDPRREAVLRAWVREIIPGNGEWPSADECGAVAYIDDVIAVAPVMRLPIMRAIDWLDDRSESDHSTPFAELGSNECTALLTELEAGDHADAFAAVLEMTYEAYYRNEYVQRVIKAQTGFDFSRTLVGKEMEPFPMDSLKTVSERPNHFRSV